MDALSGARVLFKVEKCTPSSIMFDESYRVKRVCTDPAIIKAYALEGVYITPNKVCVFIGVNDLIYRLFNFGFPYFLHAWCL